MNDEHVLLLGEIKGKLEAMDSTLGGLDGKLDGVAARVGRLETRGAVHGAIAGGFMSVGVALLAEKLKHWTGIGGA